MSWIDVICYRVMKRSLTCVGFFQCVGKVTTSFNKLYVILKFVLQFDIMGEVFCFGFKLNYFWGLIF
jgi:hypothetical protein